MAFQDAFHQFPDQAEAIRDLYKRGYGSGWEKVITRFLALVDYLAADTAFPPQRVHTSHARLLFVQQDYPVHLLVVVNANTYSQETERSYEIKYRLAAPWSWCIGYAGDVKTARNMILEGLKAAKPLTMPETK